MDSKPHWYESVIRYWPAILMIGAGLVSVIKAFDELSRLRKDYNTLQEQVNNQYRIQREMNSEVHKEIEKILLWIEYEKGFKTGTSIYK